MAAVQILFTSTILTVTLVVEFGVGSVRVKLSNVVVATVGVPKLPWPLLIVHVMLYPAPRSVTSKLVLAVPTKLGSSVGVTIVTVGATITLIKMTSDDVPLILLSTSYSIVNVCAPSPGSVTVITLPIASMVARPPASCSKLSVSIPAINVAGIGILIGKPPSQISLSIPRSGIV